MTCGFKSIVKGTLHRFPERKTVRPDDHSPFYRTVVRQLRLGDYIRVPPAIIFTLCCYTFRHPNLMLER